MSKRLVFLTVFLALATGARAATYAVPMNSNGVVLVPSFAQTNALATTTNLVAVSNALAQAIANVTVSTNVLTNNATSAKFFGRVIVTPDGDGVSAYWLGTNATDPVIYTTGDGSLQISAANGAAATLSANGTFGASVLSSTTNTAQVFLGGTFSGDGSGLTNLPAQSGSSTPTYTYNQALSAPLFVATGAGALPAADIGITAFGNGWAQGDAPGCSPSQTPPYMSITNQYPQLKSYTLTWVAPGTGWWTAESNFLAHAERSATNVIIIVTGGTPGTADEASVSNIWAHASNTANLYFIGSFMIGSATNGSSSHTRDTNWNALMTARYGLHAINPNPYLVTCTNGTAADAQSVAAGSLPVSLICTNGLAPIDWSHLNSYGYTNFSTAIMLGISNSLASGFVGNGAGVTNLNADSLTSGTLPTGRLFIGTTNAAGGGYLLQAIGGDRWRTYDGSQLSNLQASAVTSVPWAATNRDNPAFSASYITNILTVFQGGGGLYWPGPPVLSLGNSTAGGLQFIGPSNYFGGPILLTNGIYGNGAGLTNLTGSNIVGNISLGSASVTAAGIYATSQPGFYGDGNGISNLPSAMLTGTVADARLSTNVVFQNGTNVFSGTNRFAGPVTLTNAANVISGNGGGLTNLVSLGVTGTNVTTSPTNVVLQAGTSSLTVASNNIYLKGSLELGSMDISGDIAWTADNHIIQFHSGSYIKGRTGGILQLSEYNGYDKHQLAVLATNSFFSGSVTVSNVLILSPITPASMTNGTSGAMQIWNSNNAALYARGTNGVDKVLLTFP